MSGPDKDLGNDQSHVDNREETRSSATRNGLCLLVLAALVLMIFATIQITRSRGELEERELGLKVRELWLKQLSAALRMYSNESRGGRYPPKAAGASVFHPDLDMLDRYLPEGEEREELISYITGNGPVPLCYLGYMLMDQPTALHVLDELERDELGDKRPEDIKTPAGTARILRDGIERFIIWTLKDPDGTAKARSILPVAWELPSADHEETTLVLYMDGHVERRQCPDFFPYRSKFIDRLNSMLGTGQNTTFAYKEKLSLPDSEDLAPHALAVRQIASDIVDFAEREPLMTARRCRVKRCDTEPSVNVNGHLGYRIVLQGFYDDLEIVLFPSHPDISKISKNKLIWLRTNASGPHLWTLDLGEAHGYRWFGDLTWRQERIITEFFNFEGGDDRYLEYSKWVKKDDWAGYHSIHWTEGSSIQRKLDELPKSKHLTYLNQACDNPKSLREYYAAFRIRRRLQKKPYSDEVLCARSAINYELATILRINADYRPLWEGAKQAFRETPDQEAAVVIALEFAPLPDEMRVNRTEASEVSREILRDISPDIRNPIIEHLAENLQDAQQREFCQKLLDEL